MTLQKNNISATAWLDRKVVTMMSSNTQPSAVGTVLRRQVDTTRSAIPCPQNIITYNKYMGGVDRGDQLRGYYSYKIKSRKLYKYIVFFLFNVTVTNAYILRKNYHSLATFKNIKEFHVQLAKELIGNYCSRLRCGRNGGAIRQLSLRHFPVKIRDDNNKLRRGRCSYHNTVHHARVDSSWYCRECDTWLCHTGDTEDCFLMWHTKQYQ